MSTATDTNRADICAVAIAECFRGDGESLCNPIGNLPLIGGRLALATFEPQLALTDGIVLECGGTSSNVTVVKGGAPSAEQDPHRIDALSGATITSNGVARMMAFWFSDYGFGPYLKRFREGASS